MEQAPHIEGSRLDDLLRLMARYEWRGPSMQIAAGERLQLRTCHIARSIGGDSAFPADLVRQRKKPRTVPGGHVHYSSFFGSSLVRKLALAAQGVVDVFAVAMEQRHLAKCLPGICCFRPGCKWRQAYRLE